MQLQPRLDAFQVEDMRRMAGQAYDEGVGICVLALADPLGRPEGRGGKDRRARMGGDKIPSRKGLLQIGHRSDFLSDLADTRSRPMYVSAVSARVFVCT